MKVLIVAKTRRHPGACVGGITEDGRSVRLISGDPTDERAGLEYEVGEVWEMDFVPDHNVVPPHVENIIVLEGHRLKTSAKLEKAIHRFMPPERGGLDKLFQGLLQATLYGALYVAERTGLPHCSTMFWIPDQALELDSSAKRIRYRYPAKDGWRTLTFVGFQEPVQKIPAGSLLRVSLAHRWRPPDRPEEELRCFVQLSGWITLGEAGPDKPRSESEVKGPVFDHIFHKQAPIVDLRRAREVLKQIFGFSEFFPVQGDVIAHVLQRRDALVVMPTGGGKSLCYQLPALLFKGLTVVVSPLIALMQDQVSQLRELDVAAAFLNSTLAHAEYISIANRVRGGGVKILYVAPETLIRPETLLLMQQSKLDCLAVDEAHCISEWGHDFRPEYRQIQEVRRQFPEALCLALTATATPRVRNDVLRLLEIPAEGEFIASFNRANLFLSAEPRYDGLAQTIALLEKHRGNSGIIYCGTRKQVDELTEQLHANGWPAIPYHAGLEDDVRRRNQERFISEDSALMVATIAFGMGINKSNVRFIIHYHLPKDIESYYQEIGRAGRDGLPAECLLLHSRADAQLHRHFIDEGAESERPGRHARLNALMQYAETHSCRRIPLLAYFGENLEGPCGGCDNCGAAQPSGETIDVTADAQKFFECMQRTGELFGPAHIIAVLRGSRGERVLARRHDRLSMYGAGKEYPAERWRELLRSFMHLNLVEQDIDFGGLRLTDQGREVLNGKQKALVAVEQLRAHTLPAMTVTQHDPELFQRLRELRTQFATEIGMPPYIIFSDRALIEMATLFPQTEAEFLTVNGVGEAKLAKYGSSFLALIQKFCKSHGLTSKAPKVESSVKSNVRPETRRRFQEVGELFTAGESIDSIQARYGVTRKSILEHLFLFRQTGGYVDPARVLPLSSLPEATRARVIAEFKRLGLEFLAPVYEALGRTVPYDELHVLRLYLLCGGK